MNIVVIVSFTSSWADNSVTYLSLKDITTKNSINDKYEWKTSLGGESYEEGVNKEVGTTVRLGFKLKKYLNPNFYINFNGGIGYATGNSQFAISELYSDSFFNVSEVTLNLGYENLVISAGNIGQDYFNSQLFINKYRSFPGLKQKLFGTIKNGEFGLVAQQTIPTSKSFNIDREKEEEVPSLMTASLYADLSFKNQFIDSKLARIGVLGMVSYFSFADLPAVTAYRGGFRGHSLLDSEQSTAKFRYDFKGYHVNAEVNLNEENNYKLGVRAYWADNVEAKINDRLESFIYFAEKQLGSYKLDVSYQNFFKDGEVTPAVYSSSTYGGNNRIGHVYSLGLEFTDYKFKFEGKLVDTNPIVKNVIQSDRRQYYIGVETLYVEF